jgi:type II secretory pathway component PulF
VSSDAEKDPEPEAEPEAPVVLTPLVRAERQGLRLHQLMYAVAGVAVFAWFVRAAGWRVVLLFLFLAFLSGIGLVVVLFRRNETQRESLLSALAMAAERSLPLAPAALAFADQFSGSYRWVAQRLASLLNEGVPLPLAIDGTPGAVSPEAEVLIRAGWSSERLGQALRDAAALRESRRTAWGTAAAQVSYLLVVAMVMQVIIGFLFYYVAPRFEAIYKDFGIQLPDLTLRMLQAGYTLTVLGGIPLLVLGLLELTVIFLWVFSLLANSRLDTPVVGLVFRRRHTTLILRVLGLTVAGGKPVAQALEEMGKYYPWSGVRWRIHRAAEDVKRGADWIETLRRLRLISWADAGVLASAQRAGNLAWALRELAEAGERRFGYKLRFWLQFLYPLAVFGLGSLVFAFGVAYFAPLVRLIEVLAG